MFFTIGPPFIVGGRKEGGQSDSPFWCSNRIPLYKFYCKHFFFSMTVYFSRQLPNPSLSSVSWEYVSSPAFSLPTLYIIPKKIVSSPVFNAPQLSWFGLTFIPSSYFDAPSVFRISVSKTFLRPLANPLVFIPGAEIIYLSAPLSGSALSPSPTVLHLWYISTKRPLASLVAWGKWPAAGVYFYRRKGKTVIMPLRDHYNAFSPSQVAAQARFSQAVAAWHVLSDDHKRLWHFDCWPHGKRMSGFNWFISNYIRGTNYWPQPRS